MSFLRPVNSPRVRIPAVLVLGHDIRPFPDAVRWPQWQEHRQGCQARRVPGARAVCPFRVGLPFSGHISAQSLSLATPETFLRPALVSTQPPPSVPLPVPPQVLGVQALTQYFHTGPLLTAVTQQGADPPLHACQLSECHCSGKGPWSPVGITGGMRLPGVSQGSLRDAAAVRTATNS